MPAGAIGGSWDIHGIGSFAFDADAWTVQNYLDSTLATAISVTGGWGAYYLTWPSPGPQDLVAVSTAGLQFPTVAEQTAGAAGYDELRSFVYSPPTGSYTIYGNGSSVSNAADGTLAAAQLQADLETLYGSGNVSVTLTSGDATGGTLTVEFIGNLADMAIYDYPSVDTSEFTGGSFYLGTIDSGYAGVAEVQTILLPTGATGGTWTINGGSGLAYDADAAAVEAYLDSLLGQTVSVSGGYGTPFTVTWSVAGPRDLLTVDTSGLQFSSVSEAATGEDSRNETWSFAVYAPEGPFTFYGNGSSVTGYASGSIDAWTLQVDLETLYGSGNVLVTDNGSGHYTIEFVGALAGMPIGAPPSFDPTGLFSGSASFSNITVGYAGSQEVQAITLPSGIVGGTWRVDAGAHIAYNADAYTVQSYLNSVLGQSVTVTGNTAGQFTVTWTEVGLRDLLTVESIDLQVPATSSISTIHNGTIGTLFHIAYDSYGNILSVVDAANVAITDTANLTTVAYAGYRYDQATETYVMPWRVYDPKVGVFLSRDPSTGSGSNSMWYTGNDPVNAVDRSGLIIESNFPLDAYLKKYIVEFKSNQVGGAIQYTQGTGSGFNPLEDSILTMMMASKQVYKIAGETEKKSLENIQSQVEARVRIVRNTEAKQFGFKAGAPIVVNRNNIDFSKDPQGYYDSVNNSRTQLACGEAARLVFFCGIGSGKDFTRRNISDLKDAIPGDVCAIENMAQRKNPLNWAAGLEGENLICVGPDLFWGHTSNDTIKTLTGGEWIARVSGWKGANGETSDPKIRSFVEYPTAGLK